jgi:hypothetical protein
VGVVGGRLGLVITLPEIVGKKMQRQNVTYKVGDAFVRVDFLRDVALPTQSGGSASHRYFVQDKVGKNKEKQYVHVGKLVLPADLEAISRTATIPFEVLQDQYQLVGGQQVLQISTASLDMLRDREAELEIPGF